MYRCAYCERPEVYLGGQEFFEVDHFRPESKFPGLRTLYLNLYYCCGKCNRHKGNTWPTPRQENEGFRFADPCSEDMYQNHLRELEDGQLEALTACGRYTKDHIRLNRADVLEWRRRRRKAQTELSLFVSLKDELEKLRVEAKVSQQEDLDRELEALNSLIAEMPQLFNL